MLDRDAMLDAHVQFELQRWHGAALQETLAGEIAALWVWLDRVKVEEVVQAPQVTAWITRNIVELPLAPAVVAFLRENVIVAHEFLCEERTPIAAFVPQRVVDSASETLLGLSVLRREVIHQVIASSAYSMLIAHVLYHGIKGYLLTENALAKNIPGVSSFVKLGQSAIHGVAPKLEQNIDQQLIAFIKANIQETVADSEHFLAGALDDQMLRQLADEFWAANSASPVATLAGYVDAQALEQLVTVAQELWLHFRTTQLFQELAGGVVRSFFLGYGKKSIAAFLAAMGITQAMVVQEVATAAHPVAAQALASGYLEATIRRRLGAFYASYGA